MDRFKFFLERYKKECIVGGLFIILLIGGFGGFWIYRQQFLDKNSNSILAEEKKHSENEQEEKEVKEHDFVKEKEEVATFRVDIKGEVKNPGVYLIETDARVIDVIEKAGGLTKNADTRANNLSRKLKDEMVVVIYSKDEIANFREIKKLDEKMLQESQEKTKFFPNDALIKKEDFADSSVSSATDSKDLPNSDSNNIGEDSSLSSSSDSKISINTATLEELMTIGGIGESKAKAIISYRDEHGPFQKIEDIMQVSGIGEKMFEKIKEFIKI